MDDRLTAWLRREARRRADGRWLLQEPPLLEAGVPKAYVLPDDATFDEYLQRFRRLARADAFTQAIFLLTFGINGWLTAVPTLSRAAGALGWLLVVILFGWLSWRYLAFWLDKRSFRDWLASAGTAIAPEAAAAQGLTLRDARSLWLGMSARQPGWILVLQILGALAVLGGLLALSAGGPGRCTTWDQGYQLLGLCLTGFAVLSAVTFVVMLGLTVRHAARLWRLRHAL